MPELSTVRLEFLDSHRPTLPAGLYHVEVQQHVSSSHPGRIAERNVFTQQLDFLVAGEQHRLAPADVVAVFPPEGSLLDYTNALPHLILSRSTMPWERPARPHDELTPWLALLLLTEAEQGDVQQRIEPRHPLANLAPNLPLTAADEETPESVVVLTIAAGSVLLAQLPTAPELQLLTHVRRTQTDGITGPEQAVLIGNRLPTTGQQNTVHLVSVEGKYDADGQFAPGPGPVELLSLKSWSFHCLEYYHLTPEAATDPKLRWAPAEGLARLSQLPAVLGTAAFLTAAQQQFGQPVPAEYQAALLALARQAKPFAQLLRGLDAGLLTLPTASAPPEARVPLGAGYVPLPHRFRTGASLASWYHGPLAPGPVPAGATLPLRNRSADGLLRYHATSGLLDVSYAAAWELGRLLGLGSKSFSNGLYQWKRRRTQVQLATHAENELSLSVHAFPLPLEAISSPTVPATVAEWLAALSRLEGVPFNYLVPDERLLPVESIRFFQVDPLWMTALLDGAGSLGRVLAQDGQLEDEDYLRFPYAVGLSGMLLRSELVAGWPGLRVRGYGWSPAGPASQPLPAVRQQRIAGNILLCLFEGELHQVDLQLAAETLHFGFADAPATQATARLAFLSASAVPWRDESRRVVSIVRLAEQIHRATGQQIYARTLALHMVEPAVGGRFSVGQPHTL